LRLARFDCSRAGINDLAVRSHPAWCRRPLSRAPGPLRLLTDLPTRGVTVGRLLPVHKRRLVFHAVY